MKRTVFNAVLDRIHKTAGPVLPVEAPSHYTFLPLAVRRMFKSNALESIAEGMRRGWHIDHPATIGSSQDAGGEPVETVKGVGVEMAEALLAMLGINTVRQLAEAEIADLVTVPGLGPKSAAKVKANAIEMIK